MCEMECWKKRLRTLVSGPIAKREDDKRQYRDIQTWVLYNANEFQIWNPSTTLLPFKACNWFWEYAHKVVYDLLLLLLIYKGQIFNNSWLKEGILSILICPLSQSPLCPVVVELLWAFMGSKQRKIKLRIFCLTCVLVFSSNMLTCVCYFYYLSTSIIGHGKIC